MPSDEPDDEICNYEDEDRYDECEEYFECEDAENEINDDECLRKEHYRAYDSTFPSNLSTEIAELIIKAEENKSKNGLIAGLICVFLGVILCIIGVTGFINWNFAFGGINSSLTNAAPGVLLMIIGLFIIVVTNHRVTVKK